MNTKVITNSTMLKEIMSRICNQFDFSFTINKHLHFQLVYNGGTGSIKLQFGKVEVLGTDSNGNKTKTVEKVFELQGVHGFVSQLINHPNNRGHEVDPAFWENFSERTTPVTAKDYKKEKGAVYFDVKSGRIISGVIDFTNEYLQKGAVYTTDRLPGVQILTGKGVMVSVIHRGFIFGLEFEGEKDKIQAAIEFLCERMAADELVEYLDLKVDGKLIAAGLPAEMVQAAQAPKQAENIDKLINKALQAREYEVLNKAVYFNTEFKVCQKGSSADLLPGRLVRLLDFPQVVLVSHKKIDGSSVSMLYKGYLYEFDDMTKGGDQIQKAIDLIKMKGLETILKMAEEGLHADA